MPAANKPDRVSRRSFLNLVGRASGATALYQTMAAMGLLRVPEAYAGPPELARGSGKGVRVVILGAGIAGMTAAYELARAGYSCTVLEARRRAGGRNWTLRHGDEVIETDSRQRCDFASAPDLYFNPGPARIPQHHQALLGYCRQFEVPLEPLIDDNHNAFYQSDRAFGGRPVRIHRLIGDQRGYIAEFLAKAVSQHALDAEIGDEDRARFLAMLRNFGALDKELRYRGSSRIGYKEAPGAGDRPGTPLGPLPFRDVLGTGFAMFQANFGELFSFAPTMLQPVDGMDRIARAFERHTRHLIRYGAEVRQIRRRDDGVRVVYRAASGRREHAVDADYAICTIPLSVLAGIDADFSPAYKQAIASSHYIKAGKLAFQAERRFWEEDDHIYGGISWTDQDVTQIWYPSHGFNRRRGTLVAAYIWSDEIGERFGSLSPAERIALALRDGGKLHASYGKDLDRGLSVAWHKIAHSLGSWAEWTPEQRAGAYAVLNRPDGPVYLAGEHLSYLNGWQEGAVLSAHAAVASIDARRRNHKS